MDKKNIINALLVIGSAFIAQSAQAAVQYDFSYDFNGSQSIVGKLWGDLQGDADTLHVSDVLATINTPGGPFFADTNANYFVDRNSGSSHDTFGIVSLSGLTMDFVLHTGAHPGSCNRVNSACLFTSNVFVGGGRSGRYNADNWSISAASDGPVSVPEPGTLAVLGIGLLGIGLSRKFKRTI